MTEAPTNRDATNLFIALASFALAESTALTVVARDDDKQWLVLLIYVIVVCFTIVWIGCMLWVGHRGPRGEKFNQTSLWYGWITLFWNILLAGIMVALACFRLLPNQTSRRFLPLDEITVKPAFPGDRMLDELERDSGIRLTNYEAWMTLGQSAETGGTKEKDGYSKSVVWLVQLESFDEHFRSTRFKIDVAGDIVAIDAPSCGGIVSGEASANGGKQHIRIIRRAAFLVRVDPRNRNPIFRQLPFSEKGNGLGCDFLLIEPNPAERLVVLLEVRHKADLDLRKVRFVITKI